MLQNQASNGKGQEEKITIDYCEMQVFATSSSTPLPPPYSPTQVSPPRLSVAPVSPSTDTP